MTLTVEFHSRTGYYPPNHQLVIGTDPLDSFEELAELLGQAKPQTASKEDIDNSGLEVIRMSALAEYETAGRVAPMCVDRVRAPCFFGLMCDGMLNVNLVVGSCSASSVWRSIMRRRI